MSINPASTEYLPAAYTQPAYHGELTQAPAIHALPGAPVTATLAPAYASPSAQVTVNVNTAPMPMVITAPAGPSFIVRALWYLFVGWWLSAILIVVGYALIGTIIGIPLAFALFNRIPQAITLRPRTVTYRAEMQNGVTFLTAGTERQRPWYWRVLYFLGIGWWLGAVWLVLAWGIGLLVITLPISFLMYNRTSAVMTLQRH